MARLLTSRRPDWYPDDWKSETVVIVASGPSAADAPLDIAIGRAKFVAINSSWKLCPWCDVLVAVDFQFWEAHDGLPECKAPLKVCVDGRAKALWGIRFLQCDKPTDRLMLEMQGTVGWGGNSGFVTLNLVAQLEPATILLVGYDMRIEGVNGHKLVHWHAPHGAGMSNPTFANIARWRRAVDGAASVLQDAGIRVINCSPSSALQSYEKMSFEDALEVGWERRNAQRRHQIPATPENVGQPSV